MTTPSYCWEAFETQPEYDNLRRFKLMMRNLGNNTAGRPILQVIERPVKIAMNIILSRPPTYDLYITGELK